jgi:hypothetical protein
LCNLYSLFFILFYFSFFLKYDESPTIPPQTLENRKEKKKRREKEKLEKREQEEKDEEKKIGDGLPEEVVGKFD